MNNDFNIFIRHGFVPMPRGNNNDKSLSKLAAVATVCGNLAYYGYALNESSLNKLRALSEDQLAELWPSLEKELKAITGESRKMGDFVVYKNFPQEVLEKSKAEYWFAQICMYWGIASSDEFAEDVKPRKGMTKLPKPKILQAAGPLTLEGILNNYLASSARWKAAELQDVLYLSNNRPVEFAKIVYKENLVDLCKHFIEKGKIANVRTATDVLRLAAGLSNGDVSLREKVRFRRFKRNVRRFLLGMLENCGNLSEDLARRAEMWKRFLFSLHVGD